MCQQARVQEKETALVAAGVNESELQRKLAGCRVRIGKLHLAKLIYKVGRRESPILEQVYHPPRGRLGGRSCPGHRPPAPLHIEPHLSAHASRPLTPSYL
jgi:hypothetical protein